MKKIVLNLVVLFLISSCANCHQNYLQYHIANNNAILTLEKEINSLKYLRREIILVFGSDGDFNKITIIPITNHDNKIQNLLIKNTNRIINIANNKCYIVFDFDYSLGVTESKIVEDGEHFTKKEKKVYINEYSVNLYFDKNWDYIKKD